MSKLNGGLAAVAAALALAGCATVQGMLPATPQAAPPSAAPSGAAAPAGSVPIENFIGRWGVGAYHRDSDRPRTEREARAQCGNAYVADRGPRGGVMMHLADQKEKEELFVKAADGGRNVLGPPGPLILEDREIVQADGKVLVLKWLDPDVVSRYGTMIYVRCAR